MTGGDWLALKKNERARLEGEPDSLGRRKDYLSN